MMRKDTAQGRFLYPHIKKVSLGYKNHEGMGGKAEEGQERDSSEKDGEN